MQMQNFWTSSHIHRGHECHISLKIPMICAFSSFFKLQLWKKSNLFWLIRWVRLYVSFCKTIHTKWYMPYKNILTSSKLWHPYPWRFHTSCWQNCKWILKSIDKLKSFSFYICFCYCLACIRKCLVIIHRFWPVILMFYHFVSVALATLGTRLHVWQFPRWEIFADTKRQPLPNKEIRTL